MIIILSLAIAMELGAVGDRCLRSDSSELFTSCIPEADAMLICKRGVSMVQISKRAVDGLSYANSMLR